MTADCSQKFELSVLSPVSTECNIELALIDTEAHRALDVFYVTRNGRKLDEQAQNQLRQALVQIAAG